MWVLALSEHKVVGTRGHNVGLVVKLHHCPLHSVGARLVEELGGRS